MRSFLMKNAAMTEMASPYAARITTVKLTPGSESTLTGSLTSSKCDAAMLEVIPTM